MKKTKVIVMGFAVFAVMLMLMTIGLTNVEARENPDNISTSTTTNGINTCADYLRLYMHYKRESVDIENSPGYREHCLEQMEDILEAARGKGCLWATTHSMEVDMQSNLVQMNNEYTSPFTEVASGLVQESGLSQSTCSLCASR